MNHPDSQIKCSIFNDYISRDDLMVTVIVSMCNGIPASVGRVAMLEYGLNMPVPILDFKTDELGIHGVLSFGRVPTTTFVPWKAVASIHCSKIRFCAFWDVELEKDMAPLNEDLPVPFSDPKNKVAKRPMLGLVP